MRVEPIGKLGLGLATGAAFGALLHEGGADERSTIAAQLRGDDFRVVKIMGTAAVVGGALTHALAARGAVQLSVKPLKLGSVLIGGALFGVGLATLGYCPGTTLAAVGAGRTDAIAGALGMLTGAALFVRTYPRLKPALEAGDRGKITLPSATRTSPWPWLLGMAAALVIPSLVEALT